MVVKLSTEYKPLGLYLVLKILAFGQKTCLVLGPEDLELNSSVNAP